MTGRVIWITGLSGAGKTTLAKGLSLRLENSKLRPILLDGDTLRNIFQKDGSDAQSYKRDTRLNLALQYGLICQTLSDQGFTVIISTIAMFNEIYAWNRENLNNYFEIFLKVPLVELYKRDPKKIYESYRHGKITNVAGLDLTIDEPISADVVYDFEYQPFLWESPINLVDSLMCELERRSFLPQSNITR